MDKNLRPIWLLDVDGVINALCAPKTWDEHKEGIAHLDDGSYKICWSEELIRAIELINKEDVEVRWLTTWGHYANEVLRPLVNLEEEFPVQAEPVYASGYGGASLSYTTFDWKYMAVLEVLEEGRPIIWTDDDAWTESMLAELTEKAGEIPILTIKPYALDGLSRNDIEIIKSWVIQVTSQGE